MKIIQSPLFTWTVKRYHKDDKKILDSEIRNILDNPLIGQAKKGYLLNIYVHKFKIKNQQYLLFYHLSKDLLDLITIGPHENYYRDFILFE
jgi:hypothetical protein